MVMKTLYSLIFAFSLAASLEPTVFAQDELPEVEASTSKFSEPRSYSASQSQSQSQPHSSVELSADARVLNEGALLAAPEKPQVVETPLGQLNMSANSIVLAVSYNRRVAIYNLGEKEKNSVTFAIGDKSVTVGSGTFAIFTELAGESFSDVNPAHFVRYRRIRHSDLDKGLGLFQGEFDIRSAENNISPLSESKHSTGPKMCRMAAILRQSEANILATENEALKFEVCDAHDPFSPESPSPKGDANWLSIPIVGTSPLAREIEVVDTGDYNVFRWGRARHTP